MIFWEKRRERKGREVLTPFKSAISKIRFKLDD